MKILILDDNEAKAVAVEEALLGSSNGADFSIRKEKCVMSGVRAMNQESFDFLILDLLLPTRIGQAPNSQGGKIILDEIIDGSVKIPSHIICLTAYENESHALEDAVRKSLVHIIIYEDGNDAWKARLLSKTALIYRCLNQQSAEGTDLKTDIVILTSAPAVELTEVQKLPGGFVAEFNQRDRMHYYHAEWTTVVGKKSVVACAAPSMGMTAACITACKAISRWRPRFLIMTGIAASTAAANKIGDILCVETAYDYGSGKISETGDGSRVFIPSPQQLQLDSKIHSIVKHLEREQKGMNEIQSEWYAKLDRTPSLMVGIMASGAAVVQSASMVEDIKNVSRKTVGLDMEAYGVFQACALSPMPQPIAIVAKGVSDYADSAKNDSGQQLAAFTSARFIYQLCTKYKEVWDGDAQ